MSSDLELRLAHEDDLAGIEGLMASARAWLSLKGTDQWQRPWPDDTARLARMRAGILAGKTWVLLGGPVYVATIMVDWHAVTPGLPTLWDESERAQLAVYDHRMAVLRDSDYEGCGLGERLLDWTGRLAADAYGAKFVRLDAWTSNNDLHRYYKGIGFERKRIHREEEINCPSGVLFEKPLDRCAVGVRGISVNREDAERWISAARVEHDLVAVGSEA